jgi:hypothetical protein
VSSFARKIVSYDALHAKLYGVHIGMNSTRRQRITYLQVRSDLKMVVDMVTENCKVIKRISTLIRCIRNHK